LSSLVSVLYGALLVLDSFPTRRSSDLDLGFGQLAAFEVLVHQLLIGFSSGFDEILVPLLALFEHINRNRCVFESRTLVCFIPDRSEEHTSELQSRENLVCRLLLEKKKQ